MNKKNIIIVTWDYWSGKTTIMSKHASQFFCDSLIFDFTARVADQSKFTWWKVSTILMWCNGCADSNAYIEYITQSLQDKIFILFVEVPNDRINLWQVILWLEKQWHAVHVLWIWWKQITDKTQEQLLTTFADINMSYTQTIPLQVNYIEDLFVWHCPIWNNDSIEKSNNHNAWWFLKPYMTSQDIKRLEKFIQQNNTNVERCKWQIHIQGDENVQAWWYDIERCKEYGWKIEQISETSLTNHSLALVSSDQEVRKNFNDRVLWKYQDNTWSTVAVKSETINKPKMLCYEVLLWWEDKFNALLQRIESNTITDEDYDYWLLFANSMKQWTPFIRDSQRKSYYNAYYKKKLKTLTEFWSINTYNANQYLLTLANLVYLLRSDAITDMTLEDSLRGEVYSAYVLDQWQILIQSCLPFCNDSGIREFTRDRVKWYIKVIQEFRS